MRVLLIGQAPGPNTDPELPLYPVPRTSAGGRLQQMMKLTRAQYLKNFERINLLNEYPGTHKRDDKFPIREARLAARTLRPLLAGRSVVLVGRNVARAFQLDIPFHVWGHLQARRACVLNKTSGLSRVAVVPHPSGRNHWYNKAENREEAANFWRHLTRSPDFAGERRWTRVDLPTKESAQ